MRISVLFAYRSTWAAVFLLGFLLGASTATLQTGRELDRLHIQITELKGELKDRDNQINLLSSKLSSKKLSYIQKLDIKINTPGQSWANHESVRETLEQELKGLLNHTLGQPVEQIKPGLIQAIVHQRVLPTSKGNFVVKLDWLIIAPTLECQVSAKPE